MIFNNLCIFFLLLGVSLPHIFAIRQGDGSNNGDSDGNQVLVMSSDHEPIEMYVNPNGDLAYKDLDSPLDIWESAVVSNVRAKCFYWRSASYKSVEGSTSRLFTIGNTRYLTEETTNFEDAERIYCYDGSSDDVDGSVFTIFLDSVGSTSEQDSGLIKVKIGQDEDFAEIPLSDISARISTGVSGKIIEAPRRGGTSYFPTAEEAFDPDSQIGDDDAMREQRAGCYFLEVGYEGFGDARRVLDAEQGIGLLSDFDKVVCFRDYNDQRLKRRWLERDLQR